MFLILLNVMKMKSNKNTPEHSPRLQSLVSVLEPEHDESVVPVPVPVPVPLPFPLPLRLVPKMDPNKSPNKPLGTNFCLVLIPGPHVFEH